LQAPFAAISSPAKATSKYEGDREATDIESTRTIHIAASLPGPKPLASTGSLLISVVSASNAETRACVSEENAALPPELHPAE
jgi:hypothetical protein